MTDRQRKGFYFPAWHRAKAAFRVAVGRVWASENQFAAWVIGQADGTDGTNGAYATMDDVRYACHALARRRLAAWKQGVDDSEIALETGISSDDLSNAEIDLVETLFRLLADPDDIAAVMAWDNPEGDILRRSAWYLRRCNAGYVEAISRDKFGRSDWQNLSLEQMHDLVRTIKNRGNGYGQGVKAEKEGQPF